MSIGLLLKLHSLFLSLCPIVLLLLVTQGNNFSVYLEKKRSGLFKLINYKYRRKKDSTEVIHIQENRIVTIRDCP